MHECVDDFALAGPECVVSEVLAEGFCEGQGLCLFCVLRFWFFGFWVSLGWFVCRQFVWLFEPKVVLVDLYLVVLHFS